MVASAMDYISLLCERLLGLCHGSSEVLAKQDSGRSNDGDQNCTPGRPDPPDERTRLAQESLTFLRSLIGEYTMRKSENQVVELHKPDGIEPEMDIIFFPGLLDLQLDSFEEPFTKTWMATEKNDQLVWPKEWLSKLLPRARILFASCASENKLNKQLLDKSHLLDFIRKALRDNKTHDPLHENNPVQDLLAFIGENNLNHLLHDLLAFTGEALVEKIFRSHSIGQNTPVFLVGHSLGGILIKRFIQHCKILEYQERLSEDKDQKVHTFLGNLRGVFSYATPQDCSGVRHFAQHNPLLRELRNIPLSDDGYWVSEDNRKFSSNGSSQILRTFAVLEGLPPEGHNTIVVGESSARSGVDDFYIHTAADHLTVCKARDENDPVVIGKLTQFIVHAVPTADVKLLQKEERKLFDDSTVVHILNDSVWEFSSPSNREMDIIFFHGLQRDAYKDAVWRTWRAKDNPDIIWPKEWLSVVFPRARILSISYNSSATNATGQIDMYNLGRSLVSNIIDDVNYDIGQNGPVLLVGHSLGGIVIKQFILAAIAKKNSLYPDTYGKEIGRIEKFLQNLTGVFYYATPHGGSSIADFVARIPSVPLYTKIVNLLHRVKFNVPAFEITPIVKLLTTLYAHRGRINEEFRLQRTKLNVRTFGMAEGLPTNVAFNVDLIVVNEASARHDVDDFYTHITTDHYTVCQAKDMNDPLVIGKLSQFITNAMFARRTLEEELPLTVGRAVQEPTSVFGGYSKISSWPDIGPSRGDNKYVLQLNDSVWEVYSPKQPDMDIIFFHGFQPGEHKFHNAFWKTWVARDYDQEENQELLWPKEWLPKWVPKARILLISYNSTARAKSQHDMYDLGENLAGNIILDANCNAGQNRPVFLVSHSVGGIVMKQFILSAIGKKNSLHPVQYDREINRIETFLENFKGVSYYATPHGGSDVAKYANRFVHTCPVLGLLAKSDIERERINEEFRQQRRILKTRVLTQTETEEYKYKQWSGMIVDEKSARQDFDEFEKCQGSNHFDICKARDMYDWEVIGRLTQFITDTLPKDKFITVIRTPQLGFSEYHTSSASKQTEADAAKDDKYVVQLNDLVWELHSPNDMQPEMDIIFFSGLPDERGETFWRTWLAIDDENLIWPKEWLSKWFPRARILLIVRDAIESLLGSVILNSNCNAGQNCPVFLVGHSVGGIVIKDFLLSAAEKKSSLHPDHDQREIKRIETFLRNVRGVHNYATPHLSADVLAKLEHKFNLRDAVLDVLFNRPERSQSYAIIDAVKDDLSSYLERLQLQVIQQLPNTEAKFFKDFRELRRTWDIKASATGEGLPMTNRKSQLTDIVVPEESARREVDSYHTHNQGDHLTVCRARSENDYDVIGRLADFIVECQVKNLRDNWKSETENWIRKYFSPPAPQGSDQRGTCNLCSNGNHEERKCELHRWICDTRDHKIREIDSKIGALNLTAARAAQLNGSPDASKAPLKHDLPADEVFNEILKELAVHEKAGDWLASLCASVSITG